MNNSVNRPTVDQVGTPHHVVEPAYCQVAMSSTPSTCAGTMSHPDRETNRRINAPIPTATKTNQMVRAYQVWVTTRVVSPSSAARLSLIHI